MSNFYAISEIMVTKSKLAQWLNDYSGGGQGFCLGISGGKDSTIAAALCAKAAGKQNVMGILMPNGVQRDLDDAYEVVDFLGIPHRLINIEEIYTQFLKLNKTLGVDISPEALINVAPRVRMSILYAISQTLNYRVVCCSNASERYVGYCSKWGDMAGDIAPLANYTVTELIQMGHCLNLPAHLIDKIPEDGLSGKTDEENMGISYAVLDRFIREGKYEKEDYKMIEKIRLMHQRAEHKFKPVTTF